MGTGAKDANRGTWLVPPIPRDAQDRLPCSPFPSRQKPRLLTVATLVWASVGPAGPAGKAQPCQERLEHHQVAAVKGQVTRETRLSVRTMPQVGETQLGQEAGSQVGTPRRSPGFQHQMPRPSHPYCQRPPCRGQHPARRSHPRGPSHSPSLVGPSLETAGARRAHSLEHVRVLLQEGDGRRRVAGDVLVGEVHELADEGRQVARGLPVVLQGDAARGDLSASRVPETEPLCPCPARVASPGASRHTPDTGDTPPSAGQHVKVPRGHKRPRPARNLTLPLMRPEAPLSCRVPGAPGSPVGPPSAASGGRHVGSPSWVKSGPAGAAGAEGAELNREPFRSGGSQ